jgi:hypothetical protein
MPAQDAAAHEMEQILVRYAPCPTDNKSVRRDTEEPLWSKAVNDCISPSNRTDEQLYQALCETADWTVNGRAGQVLCVAPSLRLAVDRAQDHAASGAIVVAICRLPQDNIVIFAEQLARLRRLIEEREANPVPHRWLALSL